MRHWPIGVTTVGVLAALLASCTRPADAEVDATQGEGVAKLQVEVIETYPHDTEAFTQGLELHDGLLYESTGLNGESDVRIVAPETGEVQELVALPDEFFAEGLTLVDDRIWQLTWQAEIALHRDRDTLAELEQVSYSGEGWGLCYDEGNERLVMSDGTPELTFRDPQTFDELGTVSVTRDGEPVTRINELECVDDQVWANIWQTDEIVRIDPATGEVSAVVDASGLLADDEQAAADVLNGIAAAPGFGDGGDDTFLITGKLWPSVFLVRFVPAG